MHTVYGMIRFGLEGIIWSFAIGDDGAMFDQLFTAEEPPYGLDSPKSVARFDSQYGEGNWEMVFVDEKDLSYNEVFKEIGPRAFKWEHDKIKHAPILMQFESQRGVSE